MIGEYDSLEGTDPIIFGIGDVTVKIRVMHYLVHALRAGNHGIHRFCSELVRQVKDDSLEDDDTLRIVQAIRKVLEES